MKPMLARPADARLTYPLLASPKLDGIRCLARGAALLTRSLKLVPNRFLRETFDSPLIEGLDGELVVGEANAPDVFQRTQSVVMSHSEPIDGAKLHVFDRWDMPNESFNVRYQSALRAVTALARRGVPVVPVEQQLIMSDAILNVYEESCLKLGFEGVMLRDGTSFYKYGRCAASERCLMKLKRFVDSEAVIVGLTQQKHNANEATVGELGQTKRSSARAGMLLVDSLGAFQVKDVKTGVEFDIGMGKGLTPELRRHLWAIRGTLAGKLVKYRYQPTGVKDKPRFPGFVGFRSRLDL